MLRLIRRLQVRYYSSIPSTISTLNISNASTKIPNLEEILNTSSNQQAELDSIHELVSSDLNPSLKNELLSHGLNYDFSLFHKVSKSNHDWSSDSLQSLIRNNPGRVFSSWDLYEKFSNESNVTNAVIEVVINKLLAGEKVEIRDNEFKLSLSNLSRSLNLLNSSSIDNENIFTLILNSMSELNVVSGLKLITNEHFKNWFLLNGLAGLQGRQLLIGFDSIDLNTALLKETITKVLDTSFKINEDLDKLNEMEEVSFKELSQTGEYTPFSTIENTQLRNNLLEFIDSNELDIAPAPESLLIRLKLIEIYGMYANDITKVLEKYHKYQIHGKFGIEIIQSKLIQSFIYQFISTKDDHLLKIAETLNLEDIPIPILQAFILGYSTNNIDQSLKLYNDYIQQVSKKLNDVTKRSPTGLLTESLMLAFLSNKDREFAYLLFDKAIDNAIISDELEIATIKKVFKVYGDAYNDENEDAATQFFHNYLLKTVRDL